MKRILILLLVLSSCIYGFSQDCQSSIYVNSFTELQTFIYANNTKRILEQSEELLSSLESAGLTDCELYYYTKFHRGQGLELNSQVDEAVALYHEIIPKCKERSYYKVVAESYLSLARIFETYDLPADCFRNLELAYEIIKEYNLEDIESRYAIRYASYLRIYDDINLAKKYARTGIQLGEKYNVNRSISDGYLLAGILSENRDSALIYFQKAEDNFLENKSYDAASGMASNQASRLLEDAEYEKAKPIINRALKYNELTPNRDYLYYLGVSRLYRFKEEIAVVEGNIDSAYVFTNLAQENEKLVDLDVDQQKINEMEFSFALEQEKARTRNVKLISKILIGAFGLLIMLLGILALYYFRLKYRNELIVKQSDIIISKNDKLTVSNNEKELLLSEIHHRVKNNLQLVMSLLTMYSRNIKDVSTKDHFETVSEKIMSISLIHEQLYKNDDFEEIDMRDYFEVLKLQYQNLHSNDKMEIHINCDDISFNIDTAMPIGIVTTELLNNSIKYAKKDKNILQICIKLKRQSKKYIFEYKDNGPGYPNGQLISDGKTIGGFLVKSMARQLLANSKSHNNRGAVFEMIFVEKLTSSV